MEEQIDGIREDVTEIKQGMKDNSKELAGAVKEFTTSLANLHKDFLLRQEADKISEQRDKERDEMQKRITRLELWRSWLTGGLGVIVFAITVIVALIRDGVLK
jgi:septation ring formation regulator EzrA